MKIKKNKNRLLLTITTIMVIFTLTLSFSGCADQSDTQASQNQGEEQDLQADGVDGEGESAGDSESAPAAFWSNVKMDNAELVVTDEQRDLVKYFDTDYFDITSYEDFKNHPASFRGTQITTYAVIEKVINSNDSEYECIARWFDFDNEYYSFEDIVFPDDGSFATIRKDRLSTADGNLFYLKGTQDYNRIEEGEILSFSGRYVDMKDVEIDGDSLHMPNISVNFLKRITPYSGYSESIFDLDFLERITKSIFGDADISPAPEELYFGIESYRYIVTPNNLNNERYKNLVFDTSFSNVEPIDLSQINTMDDYLDVEVDMQYRLFSPSADLQHFALTYYDINAAKIYFSFYDNSSTMLWEKEIDSATDFTLDITSDGIYLIANNNLHVLDIKTGEDKIEPISVGEKVRVVVISDGVLLIGKGAENNIAKTDFEGNTLWETSVDFNVSSCNAVQITDENIVVNVSDTDPDTYEYTSVLAAISHEGSVVSVINGGY